MILTVFLTDQIKKKNTPLFAAVDINGISLDSDGDGCFDSEDPEPFSDLQKPMQDCVNFKLSRDSSKKYIEICRTDGSNNSSPGDWYLPTISFDYNSSVIRKNAEVELNYIIEIMEAYTSMRVIISGYRIDNGTTEELAEITEERSRNAIQYLTDHGISSDRLIIQQPYDRDICMYYEVDYNQSRRVEFRIMKN